MSDVAKCRHTACKAYCHDMKNKPPSSLAHHDRLHIAVDVDGVLADFVTAALKIANRLAGTSYVPADATDWEVFTLPGLPEVEDAAWAEMCEPGWAKAMAPYYGAKTGLWSLQEIARVSIVTTPVESDTWCADREKWLAEHFSISRKDVNFMHDKSSFRADLLIDDKVPNVINWLNSNPEGVGVLWAQPSNVQHPSHPRLVRTKSWAVVRSFVTNPLLPHSYDAGFSDAALHLGKRMTSDAYLEGYAAGSKLAVVSYATS